MEFDFFGILIYAILTLFLGIILKVNIDTQRIKRKEHFGYIKLQKQLNMALGKHSKITEKQQIANGFNDSIVNRLFEITKRLLFMQKFIFEERI